VKSASTPWPWGTVAWLVLALAASAWPAVAAWGVGERAALWRGEYWRLWTAHAVHFSWSHLGWSGLVWLVAGAIMERANRRAWLTAVFLVSPVITAATLGLDAQMARYGGLSGLACVPLMWIAWRWVGDEQRAVRLVGGAVLGAVVAKVAWEFSGANAAPLLASFEASAGEVRAAPWAHLLGAVGGAVLGWQQRHAARPEL
jgi:rhomboid family GlyGly-CTERM serine protease